MIGNIYNFAHLTSSTVNNMTQIKHVPEEESCLLTISWWLAKPNLIPINSPSGTLEATLSSIFWRAQNLIQSYTGIQDNDTPVEENTRGKLGSVNISMWLHYSNILKIVLHKNIYTCHREQKEIKWYLNRATMLNKQNDKFLIELTVAI